MLSRLDFSFTCHNFYTMNQLLTRNPSHTYTHTLDHISCTWPQQRKAPPASKGYPSFAEKAQAYRLGKISGGAAGKVIQPVFVHPTVNNAPPPSFDYKLAAKARLSKNAVFVYDDGLTELERKQRATIPAFLTGSAKSSKIKSEVRKDIEEQEYPFGLSGDYFQLLFISVFGLFTLVGSLSGSLQLD